MTESLPFTPLFIDGKRVPSSAGSTFQVYNPFTESVVGKCATATSEDCTAALQSAAKAFPAWEATPLAKRQEIASRAADIFEEEATKNRILDAARAETAATDASINGMNKIMVDFIRGNVEYSKLMDQVDSSPSVRVQGAKVEVRRRAMGVILAISPWNAPVFLSIRAITMPLLCGNTVILKSSEYTPRTQAIVAEVFHQAGIPPGVLNYISMTREASPYLTAQLIAYPAVRKINFTGSKRVGTIIAAEAAKHLKPCVLELGGKSPALVLADANLALAARAIVFGAFMHSGQICMSTCRVIVQRAISEELIQKICELAGAWKAGGPGEEGIQSGALFTHELAGSVVGLIQEAKNMGARIVLGDGNRVRGVVQPHVLVLDGMEAEPRIWKEESFGPELVIRTFDELEEGIALVNDSDYTLSSSLWTENKDLADSVAQRIRAGYVNINGSTVHGEDKYGLMGLGGSSGYGRFSVDDFTDRRVTVYHPSA